MRAKKESVRVRKGIPFEWESQELGRTTPSLVSSRVPDREYREKEDGASFVRIGGADRSELEHVAEAFYRRVWEQSRTRNSQELARLNAVLTDALRQRLSELVHDGIDIELRQPAVASAGNWNLLNQKSETYAASQRVWCWDRHTDRVSFSRHHARSLVIVHASSQTDTELCRELLRHMKSLKGQELIRQAR